MKPALAAGWAALLLVGAGARAETVRAHAEAFGEPATVELAGLARDRGVELARQALTAVAEAEAELAALRAAFATAAGGPVRPDDAGFALLERSDDFCRWSEGAVSALGGGQLRLWGVGAPAPGRPGAEALADAVAASGCDRLALDRRARTVRLVPGSELDPLPFAPGWAVDRATELLTAAGVPDFRLRVGTVERARGNGPDGAGWPMLLPISPASHAATASFRLQDRAGAVLAADDRPIRLAGDPMPRWLDLRRGFAPTGTRLVAAVTELAVDAQAVAWAMFALGPRAGQMALGQLRPAPSVLWQLGEAGSPPLEVVANWAAVPKR
jgi:thiamine biosynthesis lipoprotein ApbE